MTRNSFSVLQSSFVWICTCSDRSCPIFLIEFVATRLTWHLHFDGIPTPLSRYDPSASLWRHSTLHSGLPSVGAGQCHRNPVKSIFSRDIFSYINLHKIPQSCSLTISSVRPIPSFFHFLLLAVFRYPAHLSFKPIFVLLHHPFQSLLTTLYLPWVSSKLSWRLRNLLRAFRNLPPMVRLSSSSHPQKNLRLTFKLRKQLAWDLECTPRGKFSDH